MRTKDSIFGLALTFSLFFLISCSSDNNETVESPSLDPLEIPSVTETRTSENQEITIVENLANVQAPDKADDEFIISKDLPSASYASLTDLRKEFAVEDQKFRLPANRDTLIIGNKGTEIHIPRNSFETLDGKPVNDEITFSLKECYDYEDMFGENLTTRANNKALESGGMIKLSAFSKGEELKIKLGSELQIKFNTDLENMDLFYGKRNKNKDINWELDKNAKDEYPVIVSKDGMYARECRDYFARNYKLPKDDMMALKGENWSSSASFDHMGRLLGYSRCRNTTESSAHYKACNKFFELVVQIKDSVNDLRFPRRAASFDFECMSKKEYADFEAKERIALLGGVSTVFDSLMVTYYTGRLGWINCDRFMRKGPKTDYAVNTVNKSDSSDVQLYFANRRSLLRGYYNKGQYFFASLPIGEKVTIVGLRVVDGQIELAKQPVVIRRGGLQEELEYRTVTAEVLKEELKRMN